MRYLAFFCIIFYSSSVALADMKFIPKDTPAPYAGYLFDEESAQKVRLSLLELDYQKEFNASLLNTIKLKDENIEIADNRVKLYQEQTVKLAQDLQDQKSKDFWNNFLYFGLGVVTAGVLAIGLDKALNNDK